MFSVRQVLLFALQLAGVLSFSLVAPSRTVALARPQGWSPTARMMSSQDEGASGKPSADPTPPPQMMSTPSSPSPARLDPLISSLTRSDQVTDPDAKTTSIPLLGEVLDQNLFVVLPIVAFAFLGIFSFILIAANSGDAIVEALNEVNDAVLNPTTKAIDPNDCRGLCSAQEQDVEGLRNFMNSLSGNK